MEDTSKKFKQQGKFKVVEGSILTPENSGLKLIVNFINMKGTVDDEIYKTFDKKWQKIKQDVKGLYSTKTGEYKLGTLSKETTAVQSDVWVAHLLVKNEGVVNDEALGVALKKLATFALAEKATVHVSSLLMKQSNKMLELLKTHLLENGVSVAVYNEQQ